MRRITEQFFCDICKKRVNTDELRKIKYPVIFHTEQTEGRACEPYISHKDIELCHDCLGKALKIHAVGAQGYNTYSIEEAEHD